MGKQPHLSNPVIPKKPSFCEVNRIKRAGKRDARKNQGLKDFTRTQAINEFESFSQRGEIALNDWLLTVTSPYITGNARIEAEVRLFDVKIDKQKANMGTSGRDKRAAELKLAALEQEMADLYSQYAANREAGFALISRADEVKPLWENVYRLKASIYNQARSRKLKSNAEAAAAELPVYRVHPAVELEQFDRTLPERKSR
jgi:hypothetical protein